MSDRSPHPRQRWAKWLPFLWLGLSAIWAAVIVVTDQLAWPLALWIATTLGPLTAMRRRFEPPRTEYGTSLESDAR